MHTSWCGLWGATGWMVVCGLCPTSTVPQDLQERELRLSAWAGRALHEMTSIR